MYAKMWNTVYLDFSVIIYVLIFDIIACLFFSFKALNNMHRVL
jgi:hypothetical protein